MGGRVVQGESHTKRSTSGIASNEDQTDWPSLTVFVKKINWGAQQFQVVRRWWCPKEGSAIR